MISQEVAIEQVNRLYDNYSVSTPQHARENKVRLLIAELQFFTDSDFVSVCSLILRESDVHSFPTLKTFRAYYSRVAVTEQPHYQFCGRCGETGYFSVWTKVKGCWYSMPYRCSCNRVTMLSMPVITATAIPIRPHNPYKPCTLDHDRYNER